MKVFFILIFITIPSLIFAQSNYQPGYVLKNNGDTLKGYINYKEWDRSPLTIEFKLQKEEKQVTHFSPGAIKGFQIDGLENYKSYRGLVSMNLTHVPNIPTLLDTTKKADSIFLQEIGANQYLKLYYQGDNTKTRFFVAETNGEPIELKYFIYYDGANQIRSLDIYKGQLIYYTKKYAPENEKQIGKIDRLSYNQPDLKSIFDTKITGIKKQSAIRFFVGAAIASTSTESAIYTSTKTVTSQNTISPKINLGLDLFNNPNTRQLIFRAELSFSYVNPDFKYPGSVTANTIDGTYFIKSYSFDQYTATITPQVLFNIYNKEAFKVYVDGGVGINFSAYANNKVSAQNTNGTAANVDNVSDPKTIWPNLPFQVGVVLNKKIEIAFTFIKYADFTSYSGFALANASGSLGIKYLFSSH